MPNALDQYQTSTPNWRKSLAQNQMRTIMVIVLFILIYAGLGLLLDTYFLSEDYPHATTTQLFMALLTWQKTPVLTLLCIAIAIFSLLVSMVYYDKLMLLGTEYHEVTADGPDAQLYNIVEEMKLAASLRYMPRVYIIEADYMNAFASGYSEKSAMVAITRGLMNKLNRDELQAVMAHEMSHIRHLDIKVTLVASLLANMILIIIDMLFYSTINRRNNSRNSLASIILLLRYFLPIINVLLLMYLSRSREFMADAGCVELTRNNQPLASALLKIHNDYVKNNAQYSQDQQATAHENIRREAYIFDPQQAGVQSMQSISDLFSTHPPLADRLKALGYTKHEHE